MIGWFLSGYKRDPKDSEPARFCAFNDLSPLIDADDGDWHETEIDGDQALIKVRAGEKTLKEIAKAFPEVNPSKLWTPTRAKPRLTRQGDIVLDGPQVPTLPLATVNERVLTNTAYDDLRRTVDDYIDQAALTGYVRIAEREPRKGAILRRASRLGFALDRLSPGTFPTTGIIDDFNRANEGPPPSAGWITNALGNTIGIEVISSACKDDAAGTGRGYYNTSYGPASEAYCTMSTLPATGDQVALSTRLQQPGSTGDCYHVRYFDSNLYWYRVDNAAFTQLGATAAWTPGAGDSFGNEMISNTLTAYTKAGAGAWASAGSRTDGTYSNAGFLILSIQDTVAIIDNFGGGTVVAAGFAHSFGSIIG